MTVALGATIGWSIACLLGGFFIGFWRGESKQGRKAIDYWLTAEDGRVNWSRVTAAVGLTMFMMILIVFLHVYEEVNGKDMTEALFVMAGSALGLAGINLGQYIVSKKPTAPGSSSSSTSTTVSRTSQATAPPAGEP